MLPSHCLRPDDFFFLIFFGAAFGWPKHMKTRLSTSIYLTAGLFFFRKSGINARHVHRWLYKDPKVTAHYCCTNKNLSHLSAKKKKNLMIATTQSELTTYKNYVTKRGHKSSSFSEVLNEPKWKSDNTNGETESWPQVAPYRVSTSIVSFDFLSLVIYSCFKNQHS